MHRETVRRALARHHLNRITLPPVKPIERFEAAEPNDLWQIDIMGKTHFPLIGNLYLICAIDDHSRFLLAGQWFYRKFGINVYQVMYNALIRFGLPRAILSDKESRFRSTHREGQANYQWYAHQLKIALLYGKKAQTKGKIEGLFRFVQRDFVMEHLHLASIQEINQAFGEWLDDYNFCHEHEGIDKQCPADRYGESLRRLSRDELEFILVHEEPRRVLRTGAITYYGHCYGVPEEYIKRRVWTKLKGTDLMIECGGKMIAQYKLRQERYADLPAKKS